MPLIHSNVYAVTNANAHEVGLYVAGVYVRVPANSVKNVGSTNFSDDFPPIPGISILTQPYPGIYTTTGKTYIPSGCEVSINNAAFVGDGVTKRFQLDLGEPIDPGSLGIIGQLFQTGVGDNGDGTLVPGVFFGTILDFGYIDYDTGALDIQYAVAPPNLMPHTLFYCHRHSLHG